MGTIPILVPTLRCPGVGLSSAGPLQLSPPVSPVTPSHWPCRAFKTWRKFSVGNSPRFLCCYWGGVCVSKSCPLCIAAPRCFPLSNGIPEQAQCGQIFCSALFLRPPGIDIGVPARLHAMELAPFLK